MSEKIDEFNSRLQDIFHKEFLDDAPLSYEITPPDIDTSVLTFDSPFHNKKLLLLARYYLFLNREKHRKMVFDLAKMLYEAEREN